MNLCSQPLIAEELLHGDDLMLLFIGASSRAASSANIWRSANFTFLCALVGKALTAPVLKYIHCEKGGTRDFRNLANLRFFDSFPLPDKKGSIAR